MLCTGNAARSVMAGLMLEELARQRGRDLVVTTAGTHALDGQPVSIRTRAAISGVEALAGTPLGAHRSRQLERPDLDWADLVVAMEADHVRFVRRQFPQAAGRTGTLRRLSRQLPAGPRPLAERVAALHLADAELGPGEDVADPAGGDDDVYLECALELWGLCQELVDRV